MAGEIIPATGCYSVVGPTAQPKFTTSAVFWPALYHLLFSDDDERVKHLVLRDNLKKLSMTFGIDIGYYSKSKIKKRGYTKDILRKQENQ